MRLTSYDADIMQFASFYVRCSYLLGALSCSQEVQIVTMTAVSFDIG